MTWHPITTKPDADLTVLLALPDEPDDPVIAGWWDGEAWRACESGGIVRPSHWTALPDPPEVSA